MRFFFLIYFIALVLSAEKPNYQLYPQTLTLPITFYDYKEWNELDDTEKAVVKGKEPSPDGETLCDFNICSQGSRGGYCPNHTHKDNDVGRVESKLNSEGFPYVTDIVASKSYKRPDNWFKPNRWNKEINSTITLTKMAQSDTVPVYSFEKAGNWMPINCAGWDEDRDKCKEQSFKDEQWKNPTGDYRNSVFTTHFKANIIYTKDLSEITIASDDDSWLFIDGQLAIDYGGTRAPTKRTFQIDSTNFNVGDTYTVDFFHADRCATNAAFTIIGPLTCETVKGVNKGHDTDGDGIEDCLDACPENPYLVDKDANGECDDITCENIPNEKLCNQINNDSKFNNKNPPLKCSWCALKKSCVKWGYCPCGSVTYDNENVCNNYEVEDEGEGKSKNRCVFCQTNEDKDAVCAEPTECTCTLYTNIEDCHKADKGCNWCGSKCTTKKCPDCSTFTSKDECVSVDKKVDEKLISKCVWCENGSGPGKCQEKCDCDVKIKDEEACASITEHHRDEGKGYTGDGKQYNSESKSVCAICDPDQLKGGEPTNSRFCQEAGAKCTKCPLRKTQEDCEKPSATDGATKECNWCGPDSGCRTTCPNCSTYSKKEKCDNAIQDNGRNCLSCDEDVCEEIKSESSESECKDCAALNGDITKENIKKYLDFDDNGVCKGFNQDEIENLKKTVNEIKEKCEFHYDPSSDSKETKCSVCINDFFVKVYQNGTVEVPPICSSMGDCWSCEKVHEGTPDDTDKNGDTSKQGESEEQESTNKFTIFSFTDNTVAAACGLLVNKDKLEKCGYCPLQKQCQTLSQEEIDVYSKTQIPEVREDIMFKHCDTDCTLYGNDFKSCTKSALNCTWCIPPDTRNETIAEFVCGPEDQECKSCAKLTSSLQCSSSGCKWCEGTKQCITRNRPCVESIAAIGIGAGVIAGIAVAAVAGVAISSFASKKVYDAIVEARETSMDSATSNPLFEAKEDGGVNPAFEGEAAE